MSAPDRHWDVLVVGAGMSGLAAAIAASSAGVRTLVVEKAAGIGGAANLSAGMFWAPRDAQALRTLVPDGNPVLQKKLCDGFEDSLRWLEAHGMALSPTSDLAGLGEGRAMDLGRSGDRRPFMDQLAAKARAFGAQIRCSSALTGIEKLPAGFAVRLRGNQRVSASAVIIATGGFQANRTMLARYLGSAASDSLMLRSVEECTGDGIEAAWELGGAPAGDFTTFYGHTMPDVAMPPDQMQPLTPYFASYCVMVNRAGRRFVDEAESPLEEPNPQAACRQAGGRYFMIFDDEIYRRFGIEQGVASAIPALDRKAGWMALGAPLYVADSLTGLAATLEKKEAVPAAAFVSELAQYNAACSTSDPSRLVPARSNRHMPIGDGKVYALRCAPAITCTSGGVATDRFGRVLDRNGNVIPRLYAAGNDAGGIYGRRYGGYLAWALVSGRDCGANVAAELGINRMVNNVAV